MTSKGPFSFVDGEEGDMVGGVPIQCPEDPETRPAFSILCILFHTFNIGLSVPSTAKEPFLYFVKSAWKSTTMTAIFSVFFCHRNPSNYPLFAPFYYHYRILKLELETYLDWAISFADLSCGFDDFPDILVRVRGGYRSPSVHHMNPF